MVERSRYVEELGFDWVSVSEHHYSPRILTPSLPIAAAYIASHVHNIKIALLGASLMDMDFAIRCPLVRRSRLVSGSCSSARTFASRFLQTSPRGDSPCASLTLHLHQVG